MNHKSLNSPDIQNSLLNCFGDLPKIFTVCLSISNGFMHLSERYFFAEEDTVVGNEGAQQRKEMLE